MCEPTFTIFIMMRCHGVSLAWVSCHSRPVWPSGVGTGLERRPGTEETRVQAPAPVTHRVSGYISQPQAIPAHWEVITYQGLTRTFMKEIRDKNFYWVVIAWRFVNFEFCTHWSVVVQKFDCWVFMGPPNLHGWIFFQKILIVLRGCKSKNDDFQEHSPNC